MKYDDLNDLLPQGDANDPQGMLHLREQYLEAMQVQNFSPRTLENRRRYIGYFIGWSEQRGLTKPSEITKPILERYQRFLFLYRKINGDPLTFRTQFGYLVALQAGSSGWPRAITCSTTPPVSWNYPSWSNACPSTS